MDTTEKDVARHWRRDTDTSGNITQKDRSQNKTDADTPQPTYHARTSRAGPAPRTRHPSEPGLDLVPGAAVSLMRLLTGAVTPAG